MKKKSHKNFAKNKKIKDMDCTESFNHEFKYQNGFNALIHDIWLDVDCKDCFLKSKCNVDSPEDCKTFLKTKYLK